MENLKEKIKEYVDSHTDEMIDVLKDLISYRSVKQPAADGMPFGKGAADVLAEWMKICRGYGFSVRNFDNYAAHADLNGDIAVNSDIALGILCHLDVVPEGSGWSSDPYKAEIRDGKIFGRGAIDDKGPAVAALFAMRCVSELGIPLSGGVRLITGCDEENGSSDLEYYLTKEKFPPMLVTPDGNYPVINGEKGMIRLAFSAPVSADIIGLSGGNAVNAVPEYCKAVVGNVSVPSAESLSAEYPGTEFEVGSSDGSTVISVKGLCAHASTPEKGINAVTAMISALDGICNDKTLSALKKLFPFGETNGRSLGLEISDEISGGLTALFSVVNVENGVLSGKADIRYPVKFTLKEVSDKLISAFENEGFTTEIILGEEPHYVDENSAFIRTLLETYTDITGNEAYCESIGGGTYVHDTENGVAFGAEFPGEDNHMHGADEFITVESLRLNTEIYANAIVNLLRKDK